MLEDEKVKQVRTKTVGLLKEKEMLEDGKVNWYLPTLT